MGKDQTSEIERDSKQVNNDDLDLIGLIRLCWQAFVNYIFKPIEFCFRFGLKNWWKLAIICCCAYALSYSYNTWINPTYYTTIKIGNSTQMSSQFFVDQFNTLVFSSERENIANQLNMPVDSFKYIKGLEARFSLYNDTSKMTEHVSPIKSTKKTMNTTVDAKYGIANTSFYVFAKCSKYPHLLQNFDSVVVRYLTSLPVVQISEEQRKSKLQTQIKAYRKQIQNLDSIVVLSAKYPPKSYNMPLDMTSNSEYAYNFSFDDIISIQSQITTLQILINEAQNSLNNFKALNIFVPAKVYETYSPISDGIKHAAVITILCYILMLCIHYRKKISDYVKS